MKKLPILLLVFLISLSVCAFASMQAKAQDLTVSVSPPSWTTDVDQTATFTAAAFGGSEIYSYQWYLDSTIQSETGSTFIFAPTSPGSYSITATVIDSSDGTSAQSNAAEVTVNVAPTVFIAPIGPLTLTEGQLQVFTATPSGGSGTVYYQWYLDGLAVGSNSPSYSYTAEGTSHSVFCKVTDGASTPVTSPLSNAVAVTVNPNPNGELTPVPSGVLTPPPSGMLTPLPSSASTPVPTIGSTPAPSATTPVTGTSTPTPTLNPRETAAPFVFGTVDWLILIIVIIIILAFILLVWHKRRRRTPKVTEQKSQTPSSTTKATVLPDDQKTMSDTTETYEQDNYLNYGQEESSWSENNNQNISEIEIAANSLDYLKKNRNVVILTALKNPQYTYHRIKGYDGKIIIEFKEFVEICKTNVDDSPTEFVTETFNPTSPLGVKSRDLGFFLGKSGFSTVKEWIKTLKDEDTIPECTTGRKIYYLYYVHTSK